MNFSESMVSASLPESRWFESSPRYQLEVMREVFVLPFCRYQVLHYFDVFAFSLLTIKNSIAAIIAVAPKAYAK